MLWNPHIDIDNLLDEYYKMYYGEIAEVMKEFYETLESATRNMKYFKHYQYHKGVRHSIAHKLNIDTPDLFPLKHMQYNMVLEDKNAGLSVTHDGAYPGWKPNLSSAILKTMTEVYQRKFGRMPDVKVIHAGLECGIIGAVYPGMELISCGPTIKHPHSPDERVNIPSVKNFWEFLLETLENIPVKK
jgi:acetylornithine deacetylase/succinyl-diaminopimelate desuccinylase-like protein